MPNTYLYRIQPGINNAALIRKVDNTLFKGNITLHKLIHAPHKSNRTLVNGMNRTIKMRDTAYASMKEKARERGSAQIKRIVAHNVNEVTRSTMTIFKTKIHHIIYFKLLNPDDFVQHENIILSFRYMPSLIADHDFYFPSYYDVREVCNLCENANHSNNSIKLPTSWQNFKKYSKGKRHNYKTELFVDTKIPFNLAQILKVMMKSP